jgi:hypothetical protein
MRKWIAAAVLATAAAAATGSTAAASSAPIVITYEKQCDAASGRCVGTAGSGGEIEMQVTSFRPTGAAAHLTFTECVTDGDIISFTVEECVTDGDIISFTAEMKATFSPAGFIVLNGTVTEGSFAGAQVHQRSNLVDPVADTWTGELRIMPASV